MDDRKYDTNIQNTQLEHELQKLKKKLMSVNRWQKAK